MERKRVGIVVVTYNRLELLKEVIDALRKQTYAETQIVVVNNGSTDGTLLWLEEQKDLVTITQDNLGGAGGFFTGMKYVAEHHYDYCWVMDDDVICTPTALQELLEAYHRKDNIGFVCSKVIGLNGCPMNVPVVDERPTSNGYSDYYDLIEHQMIKVSMATFVSVFLKVDIIRELGLPYKDFFIWGDDSEYTSRVSSKYDCYLACKSVVLHKRALQTVLSFYTEDDPNRLKNYFYMYRNNGFVQLRKSAFKGKIKFLILRIYMLTSLLVKGDLLRFKILWKSTIAIYSFKPQIIFP